MVTCLGFEYCHTVTDEHPAKDHETAWIGEAELATLAPSPLEASWNHLEEVESAHGTKLFRPQVGDRSDRSKQKQNKVKICQTTVFFLFILLFPLLNLDI